jgi:hypothetical protein
MRLTAELLQLLTFAALQLIVGSKRIPTNPLHVRFSIPASHLAPKRKSRLA